MWWVILIAGQSDKKFSFSLLNSLKAYPTLALISHGIFCIPFSAYKPFFGHYIIWEIADISWFLYYNHWLLRSFFIVIYIIFIIIYLLYFLYSYLPLSRLWSDFWYWAYLLFIYFNPLLFLLDWGDDILGEQIYSLEPRVSIKVSTLELNLRLRRKV